MVCIKTCRLTRNPQLGDPVAWLNLTLADARELDDVALHRSPGGRWFFQGWGWLSADRRPTAGTHHCRREPLFRLSQLFQPGEHDFAGGGRGSEMIRSDCDIAVHRVGGGSTEA
jgi:hypothetical protein